MPTSTIRRKVAEHLVEETPQFTAHNPESAAAPDAFRTAAATAVNSAVMRNEFEAAAVSELQPTPVLLTERLVKLATRKRKPRAG